MISLHRFTLILFVLIFAYLIVPSTGEADGKHIVGGGMGYFSIGGCKLVIDDLNTRLKNKNYPEFEDRFFSMGGGGVGIVHRLMIGGEGHGMINKSITSGDYDVSLAAGSGFFDIGYIAYATRGFFIYPMLGIGGGGMTLKMINTSGDPSFDDILTNPSRMVILTAGGLLLDLSLGMNFVFSKATNEYSGGGFMFGVRVGYTFTPVKDDWRLEEMKITGGPETGIIGPYIRFQIGGGGISVR